MKSEASYFKHYNQLCIQSCTTWCYSIGNSQQTIFTPGTSSVPRRAPLPPRFRFSRGRACSGFAAFAATTPTFGLAHPCSFSSCRYELSSSSFRPIVGISHTFFDAYQTPTSGYRSTAKNGVFQEDQGQEPSGGDGRRRDDEDYLAEHQGQGLCYPCLHMPRTHIDPALVHPPVCSKPQSTSRVAHLTCPSYLDIDLKYYDLVSQATSNAAHISHPTGTAIPR